MTALERTKLTDSKRIIEEDAIVPDGGYGWVVMVCCFVIQVISNGLFYSLGFWLVEFQETFDLNKSSAAFVSSINSALQCLLAPLGGALANWLGVRTVAFSGCLIIGVSFALASYSQTVEMLVCTFGILGGIGMSFTYNISMSASAKYFKEKIAIALGFVMTGSALGPIVFPFVVRISIDNFSWRGAMLIIGSISMQCCVFAFLIIPVEKIYKTKRLEIPKSGYSSTFISLKYTLEIRLFTKTVFIIQLFNAFLWYHGMLTLWTLLPDYALEHQLSKLQGAELVSAIGFGYAVGRVVASAIMATFPAVDRFLMHKTSLVLAGIFLIGLQIKKSFAWCASISFCAGIFDGLAVSTLLLVTADLHGRTSLLSAYSYLLFFAGIGSLTGPYVGGVLFDSTQSYTLSFIIGGIILCSSGLILCPFRTKKQQSPQSSGYDVSDGS